MWTEKAENIINTVSTHKKVTLLSKTIEICLCEFYLPSYLYLSNILIKHIILFLTNSYQLNRNVANVISHTIEYYWYAGRRIAVNIGEYFYVHFIHLYHICVYICVCESLYYNKTATKMYWIPLSVIYSNTVTKSWRVVVYRELKWKFVDCVGRSIYFIYTVYK